MNNGMDMAVINVDADENGYYFIKYWCERNYCFNTVIKMPLTVNRAIEFYYVNRK